jgi:peptidoglycan/LPS O-acetylase OafA/YrhL
MHLTRPTRLAPSLLAPLSPRSDRDRAVPWGDGAHVPQLDALRAFAVLAVLASHYCYTMPFWSAAGAFGVRLFFVLSGFLITGILLRSRAAIETGHSDVAFAMRQFYVRRFLRIFPLFYATLLIAWALGVPAVRADLGWHLAYLSNVRFAITNEWPAPLSHFWSLAVEEQFYLVWPAFVLLSPRRLLRPALLALIAVGPLWRGLGAAAGLREMVVWNLPFTALDSLGIGSLLALATTGTPIGAAAPGRKPAWALYGAAGAAVLLLVAWFIPSPVLGPVRWLFGHGGFLTAISLVFAGLVLQSARGWPGPVGRALAWGPLTYLGRISYGVYVVHLFTPGLVRWALARAGLPYPETPGLVQFTILTAATIALAAASWHLFERPLNDLKRHFPYVRPPATHRVPVLAAVRRP